MIKMDANFLTKKRFVSGGSIFLLGILLGACGGGSGFSQPDGLQAYSQALNINISGLNLTNAGLVLANGSDYLSASKNGAYTFANPVPGNGSYTIVVNSQPSGQICTVNNGTGSGVIGPIPTIQVICSTETYAVSGSVSGLAVGQQATLTNNGADPITVTANGAFSFSTPVAYNGSYAVTVGTQPTGQTCTVGNASGAGVTGAVSNVVLTCSTNAYAVSGSVSGLAVGQQATLTNNGADPITVTANGAFSFSTPVAYNGSYAVTVGTQPTGQTCTVGNASGAGVTGAVSNVVLTCSTNAYAVSGSVSGLAVGQQATLTNNGADPITVTANGAFSFSTPVAYNGSYAVTVGTQPTGQTCTVGNASGAGVTGAVSNVVLTCSTNAYAVSGSVSGLAVGQQATLTNNGADPITVTANGAFSFSTPVAYNGSYAVTVGTQPAGQTCTVGNASGAGVTGAVSNVTVVCATSGLTVGGTISGLTSGLQVTLNNNGGDALTVSANGSFTFATPIATNSSYSVNIATQPVGETCIVSNSSGTNVTSNITSISIACSATTDPLSLVKFSTRQLADAQWDVTACTTTTTCNIFSNTPGTIFSGTNVLPAPAIPFDWATCGTGAYINFEPNMVSGVRSTINPWVENLYYANGTLCQAGATGNFIIAGYDLSNNFYLFYQSSNGNTGTIVTANSLLTGSGFSFTGTSNPSIIQVNQYLAGL